MGSRVRGTPSAPDVGQIPSSNDVKAMETDIVQNNHIHHQVISNLSSLFTHFPLLENIIQPHDQPFYM